MLYPHEMALGDVYISPVLAVVVLAFFATGMTTIILNKLKISQYIYLPPFAFLAILTLYIVAIDKYMIKI